MLSIVKHRCFALSLHLNHLVIMIFLWCKFVNKVCLKRTVKGSFVSALAHT